MSLSPHQPLSLFPFGEMSIALKLQSTQYGLLALAETFRAPSSSEKKGTLPPY